jgi:hypothetical protein
MRVSQFRSQNIVEGDPTFTAKGSSSATKVPDAIFRRTLRGFRPTFALLLIGAADGRKGQRFDQATERPMATPVESQETPAPSTRFAQLQQRSRN